MTGLENFAQLKKNQEWLDSYENKIGLSGDYIPSDIKKYMTLQPELLERFQPTECSEAAILLSQYSYYIQKQLNRENAELRLLQYQFDLTISEEMAGYDKFVPYQERKFRVIKNNQIAKEAYQRIVAAEQKIETLKNLNFAINKIIESLLSLQKAKTGIKYDIG